MSWKRLRWISFGVLIALALVGAYSVGSTKPIAFHLQTIPSAAGLVDLRSVDREIRLDMRYATPNNFTHRTLYSQARCLLRPSVAARLAQVQADLTPKGLRLKVYDCYRPLSVQKKLWQLVPNSDYVANPAQGSRHNRGSAVDLTLVDANGRELPMPSGFDDFSDRAHLDYQGGSPQSRQNRQTLQRVMRRRGFTPLRTEWWHFDDANWQRYPIMDTPFEDIPPS